MSPDLTVDSYSGMVPRGALDILHPAAPCRSVPDNFTVEGEAPSPDYNDNTEEMNVQQVLRKIECPVHTSRDNGASSARTSRPPRGGRAVGRD